MVTVIFPFLRAPINVGGTREKRRGEFDERVMIDENAAELAVYTGCLSSLTAVSAPSDHPWLKM